MIASLNFVDLKRAIGFESAVFEFERDAIDAHRRLSAGTKAKAT